LRPISLHKLIIIVLEIQIKFCSIEFVENKSFFQEID
jgi:hypothetical protein